VRILISGGIGIGKSTFCDRLNKEFGYPIHKTGRHANNIEHFSFGLRQSFMELLSLEAMFDTKYHNCVLDRWLIDFLMWQYEDESFNVGELLDRIALDAIDKDSDVFLVSPNPPLNFYLDNINDFRGDYIRWSAFSDKYIAYLREKYNGDTPHHILDTEVLSFIKDWTDNLIDFTVSWLKMNELNYIYVELSDVGDLNWRQVWQDAYMDRLRSVINETGRVD